MKYVVGDSEPVEGRLVGRREDTYTIQIGENQHTLKILRTDSRKIEFVLDQTHHSVKYADVSTAGIELTVDGTRIKLRTNTHLDDIVYKNSGGSAEAADTVLYSQIPGKVISIAVNEGDSVAQGDTVCTLESMKMQVGVKSHRAGTVSSIKVKKGDTVAKNDIIAEIQ